MKGINLVWLSKTDLTNLNAGEGETNYIDVKKFKKEGKEFPYVSGQAMRFYIREAIRRNLSDAKQMCTPNDKGETCGKIAECLNCDLFGFMTTLKGSGSATRVSPVKVSPAMGLLPFDENAVVDFLTRKKPQEKVEEKTGDIVNVEIGTNIYKCGVAVDAVKVGKEEDWSKGHVEFKEHVTEQNERTNRVKKVIEGIRFLTDYSKQARLLTDFTPDIICVSLQGKYSHRLQKLFEFVSEEGKIVKKLDVKRIEEILSDVKDYSDKILFGMISGIIDNEDEVKEAFQKFEIEVKTPKEVLDEAAGLIKPAE